MVAPWSQRAQNVLLLIGVFAVTGCATTGFHTHQSCTAIPQQTRVLVMPLDIQLFELTAGGLEEPRADWTQHAKQYCMDALNKKLETTKDTVVLYEPPPHDFEQAHTHQQFIKLHETVGNAILVHAYLTYAVLPTKNESFDWGLGEKVRSLKDDNNADYAMFVFIRNTASAMAFVQLATAAAGHGYAGNIGQLVALAGIMAYSRDMERESDDIGLTLMAEAGYDPREAPRIWKALEAERDAADDPDRFIFFATHPSTKERTRTLESRSEQLVQAHGAGERRREAYLDATRDFRAAWLRDEIRKRDFAASEVVLDHLAAGGDRPGEVHYYRGELFRLRGEDNDLEKALQCYRQAAGFEDAPPMVYRDMGLVHWKLGHEEQAREYLEVYLERAPQASDHAMIRAYLLELD